MSRSHDYHCRNCHEWVNGFFVDDGGECGCSKPDLFYDLNHEAECCWNEEILGQVCEQAEAIARPSINICEVHDAPEAITEERGTCWLYDGDEDCRMVRKLLVDP